MFEMLDRDGLARIGRLDIGGRRVETPVLLPVVNPRVGPIGPQRLSDEFGVSAIIANSFMMTRDDELRSRALGEGVHRLLGFDGVIMTDSGTFQEHVYGSVDIDPQGIVEFQREIGSDIGTVLDVFSEPDFSLQQAQEAVETTVERAEAAAGIRGDMWLAGTVQGSLFPELRESCARRLSELDIQVHPIGGVVPLMEGYRFSSLVDVIIASKRGLVPSRPVHLFGAGHPMLFPLAVLLGCDMFDSASYAKFARDGRMMFSDGTVRLEDIDEFWCRCPVCSRTDADGMRELDASDRERLMAEHNLHACQGQLRRIRSAIRKGELWELVERTCGSHPGLVDALRALLRHNDYLERFEPLSREGALLVTRPESLERPSVKRYQKRLFERYRHPRTEVMIALPEASRPYSRSYRPVIERIGSIANSHFVVLSPVGPVPIELDEVYPVGQMLLPECMQLTSQEEVLRINERFSHEHEYGIAILWDGDETIRFLESMRFGSREPFDIDRSRTVGVLTMQFGRDAARAVEGSELSFVKSRRRGRIRNIHVNGKHAFSIRANDGFISLTDSGARLLHEALPSPSYRVTVSDDALPFVRQGANVFAKFVTDCDPQLRPRDDVLIVDAEDALIGHGRALMNREEMLSFRVGMAVRTRSRMQEDASQG